MFSRRKKKKKEELLKKRETQKRNRVPKVPPLKISEHLSAERVCFFRDHTEPGRVFSELLARLPIPDAASALSAILEREKIGSTVIAPGIALPHARIPGLQRLYPTLAICPKGIEQAGNRVHVYLLFFSPAEDLKGHLRFLAGASALFQKENALSELASLETAESVLEKIRQMESASHA